MKTGPDVSYKKSLLLVSGTNYRFKVLQACLKTVYKFKIPKKKSEREIILKYHSVFLYNFLYIYLRVHDT